MNWSLDMDKTGFDFAFKYNRHGKTRTQRGGDASLFQKMDA